MVEVVVTMKGAGVVVVVELMLVVMLVIKVVRVWGMKLCQ